MGLFKGTVYLSTKHGTSSGIWPRFYFQLTKIAEPVEGKEFFDRKSTVYFEKVIPEISNLYDLYHEVQNMIRDYKEGISNGTYYKVNDKGQTTHFKNKEADILNGVKNFLVRAKITVVNFAKCGLVDDSDFSFSDLLFCNSDKFQARSALYLEKTDGRYLPILKLIESANKSFFPGLNELRGTIEHDHFILDDFVLDITSSGVSASEPRLQDKLLSMKLEYYYDSIMDFMEKAGVYFYGLGMEAKGPFQLHVREDFNYSEMRYKYFISLGGMSMGYPSHRCHYD